MNEKIPNNLKTIGVFKDFSDGSIKTVFKASNGGIIEITLLFNKPNIDVVCVPTHHFCNLGCKMCHLTNKGLNKSMLPIQSDDMIEAIIKAVCYRECGNLENTDFYTKESIERRTKKRKLLVSFMGIGEPLLNLLLLEELFIKESYLKEILQYSDIGYALATMMPNGINELIELVMRLQIPLKVHFSMHSPYDKERFALIPSTRMAVEDALLQLKEYENNVFKSDYIMEQYKKCHQGGEPVEIHYTLIKNVNDSSEHLNAVIRLLKKYTIPIKFIRFNPINNLEISSKEDIWVEKIHDEIPNLRIKVYSPPGREIGSSCGEFTKHYYHEEIESAEQLSEFHLWEKQHKIYENHRRSYISWDEYYMGVAILASKRSKDPSTQVGACIVSKDNRILSVGYNGTPNAIKDECFNWGKEGDKYENKYAYVIHAEVNAILNYKGNTNELNDAILYVTLFPCNECAKFIVQSGIKKVVFLSDKYHDKKETIASKNILSKCGIEYIKYSSSKKELTISYCMDKI